MKWNFHLMKKEIKRGINLCSSLKDLDKTVSIYILKIEKIPMANAEGTKMVAKFTDGCFKSI